MSDSPVQATTVEKDQFRFLKRLPWEKITIWAVFLVLLYLFKSFFTIIFLTFIISYITWNLVGWATRILNLKDPSGIWRRIFTVVIYLLFLSGIIGSGWIVVPKVVDQGNLLVQQIRVLIPSPSGSSLSPEERADKIMSEMFDEARLAKLRKSSRYEELRKGLIEKLAVMDAEGFSEGDKADGARKAGNRSAAGKNGEGAKDLNYHLEKFLENVMGPAKYEEFKKSPEYRTTYADLVSSLQGLITENIPSFVDFIRHGLAKIVGYSLDFLLSILFSFMVVFSLPSIAKNLPSLEKSKIGGFYKEIAPSVVAFSRSMGRAFQGQAIIALCNTALTLVGMEILGIPNAAVLSVIVFICSFIPVLGVFISSVPICLVAIQKGGIMLAIEAAGLITVIHMIEAYFLNPRILGSVMKMHPLLVLVLLFTFEHFFGVWGLLLAVPAFHYIFYQVIMGRKPGWLKEKGPGQGGTETGQPQAAENARTGSEGIGNQPMAPPGKA